MQNTTDSADGEFAALRTALAGQYDLQRELGRGGMGIVLLARDVRLDRSVALKLLPPHLAQVGDTRERFLREARMAAQLSHPNIVPVYRADELGGFAFFTMGFVDGETLGERIRDRGALPAADVVRILREVAWALAYAHARGIVHRDVKPDNILLERGSGRAVVTDFGIARADFNPALTQDGLVLGSVHFMSPEQASGTPLDGRSDLYALACIGFLALSGRLPFEDAAPQAVLFAHATKEPPALRSVAPTVPAALAAVIDRGLRKSPQERHETGEALADALGKALDAVQQAAGSAGASGVISSDEAMAVWRRAAELQAEAAMRLETRMRETNDTQQLAPVAPDALGSTADNSSGSVADHRAASAIPADTYRVADVESAALEVGISQRYVALALAELKASPAAMLHPPQVSPWKERLVTRVLGITQRTLSVSRVFRHPPRDVLQALGRSLRKAPFSLGLRDTLGGHPLDGGVLVFDIPAMVDGNYHWTYTRYAMYVPEIRLGMSSVAGDPKACEVTLTVDLRRGFGTNAGVLSFVTGLFGAFGGLIGAVVGKAALALTGATLVGPAVGGAVVLGAGVVAISGPTYRGSARKAATELSAALTAVDAGIRAYDIFGEPPPPPRGGPPSGMSGDDPLLFLGV